MSEPIRELHRRTRTLKQTSTKSREERIKNILMAVDAMGEATLKRNMHIFIMRAGGMTFTEIGKKYHMTRGRMQAIFANMKQLIEESAELIKNNQIS